MLSNISPALVGAGVVVADANGGTLSPVAPTWTDVDTSTPYLIMCVSSIRNNGVLGIGTRVPNVPAGFTLMLDMNNTIVFGKIGTVADSGSTITCTFNNAIAGSTSTAQVCVFENTYDDIDDLILASSTIMSDSAVNIAVPRLSMQTIPDYGVFYVAVGWKRDNFASVAQPMINETNYTEIGVVDSTLGNDSGAVWGYYIEDYPVWSPFNYFRDTGGTSVLNWGGVMALRWGIAETTYGRAMSRGEVVRAPVSVSLDWASVGYSGASAYEDFSPYVGTGITVEHSIDDGMPSNVTTAPGGAGLSKAVVPVVDGPGGMSGQEFLNPYNTDSPLYGIPNDITPMVISVPLVTDDGIVEEPDIFHGQMASVLIKQAEYSANIEGQSTTKTKLSATFDRPIIAEELQGCNNTWVITNTLHELGVYPSPPRRSSARLHMTMHGSGRTNRPNINGKYEQNVRLQNWDANGVQMPVDMCEGPYVNATLLKDTATGITKGYGTDIPLDDGDDFLSQASNVGRLEFFIRGDERNVFDPFEFQLYQSAPAMPATPRILCGIDSAYQLYLMLNDGTHATYSHTSTPTLPLDGEWHAVGFAWDVAGNALYMYIDGDLYTYNPGTAMTTPGLPLVDDLATLYYGAVVPIAELQLTSGVEAGLAAYPYWIDQRTWTPTARVIGSDGFRRGVSDTTVKTGWELLGEYAQDELAWTFIDEYDRFVFYPRGHLASPHNQFVAEELESNSNVGEIDLTDDISKVFNKISMTYTNIPALQTKEVAINDSSKETSLLVVEPSTSTHVWLQVANPITYVDISAIVGNDATADVKPATNYFTANTDADGSGTYDTVGHVVITIDDTWYPDKLGVTITTDGFAKWYFVNTKGWPSIALYGSVLAGEQSTVEVQDAYSIVVRGVRALPATISGVHDALSATQIAQSILDAVCWSKPKLDVNVLGDSRRQIYDRIIVDGEYGQLSLPKDQYWRSMLVEHRINGSDYNQKVQLVQDTRQLGKWVSDVEADPVVLAAAGVWDGTTVWVTNY